VTASTPTTGPLVLLGGSEWTEGAPDDPVLRTAPVLVLPTAAAYENPAKLLARGEAWYRERGVETSVLPVYRRPEALQDEAVARIQGAGCVFLTSGGGQHLRSVLYDSPLLTAVVAAWRRGTVLAASGQSATTLCDPMVDGRGGAFAVGLGVVEGLTVVPRLDEWSEDKLHRTIRLAPAGLAVVGIPHRAALVHEPGGGWRTAGVDGIRIWRDGAEVGLDALPTP
jgi:cyanophycinase